MNDTERRVFEVTARLIPLDEQFPRAHYQSGGWLWSHERLHLHAPTRA